MAGAGRRADVGQQQRGRPERGDEGSAPEAAVLLVSKVWSHVLEA